MIVLFALSAWLSVPAIAETEVRLSVGGAGGEAAPVLALPHFVAADPRRGDDALAARDLRAIVRSDLYLSRRFDVKDEDPGAAPEAGATWRLKAQVGREDEKISASVRLENGRGAEAVFERYYRHDFQWIRSLAHRIADDIVKAATGRDGIARTRIAFINDQSGHKEVYVMDYDGENLKKLTNDRSIDLLPRFSADGRRIAYTGYREGNPNLYLLDLDTGHATTLSEEQGLNIAGSFSPDGRKLLMTLSRGRSPNLYMKDLASGALDRLTTHFGADSTPTFSPDARQVAFVSDRSGNPQIYVLDLRTKQARRLTNLNWCDSPAWSPTGEWVAFAGRANRKDKMDIFLVDVTGAQIRQLTHGEGSNEDPTWSPDGRLLAFSSTRAGRAQIYVMDADGSAPRLTVNIGGASSTPHWSSLRQ
jgi:TolB protein